VAATLQCVICLDHLLTPSRQSAAECDARWRAAGHLSWTHAESDDGMTGKLDPRMF
jgi:hypothetical protein